MTTARRKPAENGQHLADAVKEVDEIASAVIAKEREWLEAGMDNWSAELTRYFDELSRHTHLTLTQLCVCQTPMDVLKVEQEWWAARSKAYLESGLRFAQTFSEAAARLGAPAQRFDAL